MHEEKILKWFDRMGLERPEQIKHDLTPDDIASRVRPVNLRNWHLNGNRLTAESDFGDFSYLIPPNYIMMGTDNQGLPILKKIDIT